MNAEVRRSGNLIEIVCGAVFERELEPKLSYWHRQFYRGQQLRQRIEYKRVLGASGDPAAASFRPKMDLFKVPLYRVTESGNLACPAGFKHRVVSHLQNAGYAVAFNDLRTRKLPPMDFSRLAELPDGLSFRHRQADVLTTIDGTGMDNLIIGAPTGFGKALTLDSDIQTPRGPIKMRDVAVGDVVCDVNGGTAKVIGVWPQGRKSVYRVTFVDGDHVDCCAEHLWEVKSNKLWAGKTKVLNTQQLLKKVKSPSGQRNLIVRVPKPLEMTGGKLPIHPYVLGVLLGDGSITGLTPEFTSADAEIVTRVSKLLVHGYRIGRRSCEISFSIRNSVRQYGSGNFYTDMLQILGLHGLTSPDKFIPSSYLYASLDARIELLRGLLDTDGTVGKTHNVSYSTSSKRLADGVKWLVESLGGICRVHPKPTSSLLNYICSISLDNPKHYFTLRRKRARAIGRSTYPVNRVIKSIVCVGTKLTQCITVDAADGLYLTNNCVVTHNTHLARLLCWVYPRSHILFITPGIDTLKGLEAALRTLIPADIGMVGGGKCQPNKRVTLCSLDSVHKAFMDRQDLIIGDEVHEYAAPEAQKNLNGQFTEAKWVGFSASFPGRGDGADDVVEAMFGPKMLDISYQEAADHASVTPIQVLLLDIPTLAGYSNQHQDDTAWQRHAYWRNDGRNKIYAEFLKSGLPEHLNVPDPQILCMVETIDHAFELRKFLPDYQLVYAQPADAEAFKTRQKQFVKRKLWRDGELPMTDELRDAIRQQFESGSCKKAIATHCWKQGVNFVELHVLARVDGGQGFIDGTQIPGRLSRIKDGKECAVLIDSQDDFDPRASERSAKRVATYAKHGWRVTRIPLPGVITPMQPTLF